MILSDHQARTLRGHSRRDRPEAHFHPRAAPNGVIAHFARLRMTGAHKLPLPDLLPRLADAAMALADAKCDVIAFHCTAIALDAGPT